MLAGALVLVAEDQPFIALDIAYAIEDAGGKVAGPVASVAHALAIMKAKPIAAAILDFNLTDGDIVPVLQALLVSNIPVILQSGVGLSPELMARFPGLKVYIKPTDSAAMVAQLGVLLGVAGL